MKPSVLAKIQPMSSITQKSEYETIATNIMRILARTGDTFRSLSWREYKKERLKDKGFEEGEKGYFNRVKYYCSSAKAARNFCEGWKNAK